MNALKHIIIYAALLGIPFTSFAQDYSKDQIELEFGAGLEISTNNDWLIASNRYHRDAAINNRFGISYWHSFAPSWQVGIGFSYRPRMSYNNKYDNNAGKETVTSFKASYCIANIKTRYLFTNSSSITPYVEGQFGTSLLLDVTDFTYSQSTSTKGVVISETPVEDQKGRLNYGVGFGLLLKNNFKIGFAYEYSGVKFNRITNVADFVDGIPDNLATMNTPFNLKNHVFEVTLAYEIDLAKRQMTEARIAELLGPKKGLNISAGPVYSNLKGVYHHVGASDTGTNYSEQLSSFKQNDPVFEIAADYVFPLGKSFAVGAGVSYQTPTTYSWLNKIDGVEKDDDTYKEACKDYWYKLKYSKFTPYMLVEYNFNNIKFAPYFRGKVGYTIANFRNHNKQGDEDRQEFNEDYKKGHIAESFAMGCRLSNHFGLELGTNFTSFQFSRKYESADRKGNFRDQEDTVKGTEYSLNLKGVYYF